MVKLRKKRKLKKSVKITIFIFIILIIIGGYFAYTKIIKNDKNDNKNNNTKTEVKKLKILDEESNTRPIAVMINNNHAAWPHAGLESSFLNYEIIAEGGITRIMALFKDISTLDKIGSVRSSRPYFLDYVLESDAIYAHWGGSEQAYSDIKSLKIDNIDALKYEGKYFFRDKSANKQYEHTGFTKMSMLKEGIEKLGYKTTTNKGNVFDYSVDPINISEMENVEIADEIEIPYSNYHTTTYVYDKENKVYKRSMSGKAHVDAITGKQYTAKNIITYKVKNSDAGQGYGRQKLDNITSGEGYYITEGYAVPITWEKESRSSKTVYKYKTSKEEIKLNDGNTWIQIQPKDRELKITSNNPDINE